MGRTGPAVPGIDHGVGHRVGPRTRRALPQKRRRPRRRASHRASRRAENRRALPRKRRRRRFERGRTRHAGSESCPSPPRHPGVHRTECSAKRGAFRRAGCQAKHRTTRRGQRHRGVRSRRGPSDGATGATRRTYPGCRLRRAGAGGASVPPAARPGRRRPRPDRGGRAAPWCRRHPTTMRGSCAGAVRAPVLVWRGASPGRCVPAARPSWPGRSPQARSRSAPSRPGYADGSGDVVMSSRGRIAGGSADQRPWRPPRPLQPAEPDRMFRSGTRFRLEHAAAPRRRSPRSHRARRTERRTAGRRAVFPSAGHGAPSGTPDDPGQIG